MELPAIVTMLALLEYMFFSLRVGLGREKLGVPAPATTGNAEWERMFRGQQNTLEQLIVASRNFKRRWGSTKSVL